MSGPARLGPSDLEALAGGRHPDPFAVLGPHRLDDGSLAVRVLRPGAAGVTFIERPSGRATAMTPLHGAGVFEIVGGWASVPDYRLRIVEASQHQHEIDDPYRYGPVFGEIDAHLLAEGTHHQAQHALGARIVEHGGASGVHFAVWAPNAARVSVVGDFNGWHGGTHPMRFLAHAGVWEIFLPGLGAGPRYKFELRDCRGRVFQKADPFGRTFETPPDTASIVWADAYTWSDEVWMARRASAPASVPMSVYEVHLGSWRRAEHGARVMTYREMAATLVPYVAEMGFTHIELLPVMEHPFPGSWGYQVIGFFAPTSRYGAPDDFRYFVDTCHRHGLGVLLDWVPGHFPKDAHGLARFDGTALYEHADPRQGEHQDWGTLIFNYGRHEVQAFLLSSALFWLREFHLDGLRVDAVASMLYLDYSREAGAWVPNRFGGRENLEAVDFLQRLTTLVRTECPGAAIMAEESTSWPGVTREVHLGGLGFTHKWNMGWMHDMLAYCGEDPVYRKWHHDKITFSLLYAFSEHFLLPFSHDEVVHGKRSLLSKMPGDVWQKHATLRALLGYMFVHPGRKLLFMGAEIGQWREWNHDWELDWAVLGDERHAGLQRWVRDLNLAYRDQSPLWADDDSPAGFSWIDCHDHEHSVISLMRRDPTSGTCLAAVINFTPVPRHGYRVGLPVSGRWRERLNSDAVVYGGSGSGNAGVVVADDEPRHGHLHSAALVVPPLGFLLLAPDAPTPQAG